MRRTKNNTVQDEAKIQQNRIRENDQTRHYVQRTTIESRTDRLKIEEFDGYKRRYFNIASSYTGYMRAY